MDTTMLLLGMVKLENPKTKETLLVEVKGFDVIGFFFPFIRLIVAGMWGKVALFCCGTFLFYPIWAWYVGFNYKRMRFDSLIAKGWKIAEDIQQKAA